MLRWLKNEMGITTWDMLVVQWQGRIGLECACMYDGWIYLSAVDVVQNMNWRGSVLYVCVYVRGI